MTLLKWLVLVIHKVHLLSLNEIHSKTESKIAVIGSRQPNKKDINSNWFTLKKMLVW